MNDLAEKLKTAGVDTVGARLTTACTDAIRKHPDNVMDAWRYVGAVFGHEFVRGIMNDMQPEAQIAEPKAFARIATELYVPPGVKPYQPRVIPPERLEKRRALRQIVRSKYMNSGGIAWSEVGWHELSLLKRDGNEAEALLAACASQVPNDGRTVGDVLGIKRTDEVIAQVRSRRS